MTGSILSYQQQDSIKLLCEIDLRKLLPDPKQRERFNNKWNDFIESDPHNNEIFELEVQNIGVRSSFLTVFGTM